MIKLFDTHCHLQFSAFNKDRELVVKRARENNIAVINVGTDKKSSQEAVELAEKYGGFFAAIGQHPTENKEFDAVFFENLAKNPKVVAIGETGLDYYRLEQSANREAQITKQKEVFIKHIELAKKINKPLMIHCRAAFNDLIKILNSKSYILNSLPGVLHFFTGSLDDAKKLLNMGFYFTFGGLITFNRSFDEIIKFISLERILLETDAPFVAPEPYCGKRNEPSYIIETAKKMAEIKSVSFEKICEQTMKNAEIVFRLGI